MLLDATPFQDIWRALHKDGIRSRAILLIVRFLERRLGARFVYDTAALPSDNKELFELFELAGLFKNSGIIKSFQASQGFPDEPPLRIWNAVCATSKEQVAGGMAVEDDRKALIAALAEALERYIWFDVTDYFLSPMKATIDRAKAFRPIITPYQFAGYSPEQRTGHSRLTLRDDAEYLWIKGYSHAQKKSVWVPAQVISGRHGSENAHSKNGEPIILETITTGLATGPTKEFSLLGGALEIIERDAFMITWLNQLSPRRLPLRDIAQGSDELSKLFAMCERYRLHVEAARLPTDAPTYTVCAIVRDESGVGPQVTIGLRADKSLEQAVRGATLEALRIRRTIRYRQEHGRSGEHKGGNHVVHIDRADYWAVGDRYKKIAFLTSGEMAELKQEAWEKDTDSEHLQRIVEWCRTKKYEFVSVDLTRSERNVSPWYINMVVMPDMIPMHQNEHRPYSSGERLQEIPAQFGFQARPTPYLEEPHPFA